MRWSGGTDRACKIAGAVAIALLMAASMAAAYRVRSGVMPSRRLRQRGSGCLKGRCGRPSELTTTCDVSRLLAYANQSAFYDSEVKSRLFTQNVAHISSIF